MAATAEQISRLRRMVGDVEAATYSNADLAAYIERYPLLDPLGRSPYQVSSTSPPEQEANPDWTVTYDLNAAAGDIWSEKAGAASAKFDFTEDAQSFSRSQIYKHCSEMARYYRARRSASTVVLWPYPRRNPTADLVVNSD